MPPGDKISHRCCLLAPKSEYFDCCTIRAKTLTHLLGPSFLRNTVFISTARWAKVAIWPKEQWYPSYKSTFESVHRITHPVNESRSTERLINALRVAVSKLQVIFTKYTEVLWVDLYMSEFKSANQSALTQNTDTQQLSVSLFAVFVQVTGPKVHGMT